MMTQMMIEIEMQRIHLVSHTSKFMSKKTDFLWHKNKESIDFESKSLIHLVDSIKPVQSFS